MRRQYTLYLLGLTLYILNLNLHQAKRVTKKGNAYIDLSRASLCFGGDCLLKLLRDHSVIKEKVIQVGVVGKSILIPFQLRRNHDTYSSMLMVLIASQHPKSCTFSVVSLTATQRLAIEAAMSLTVMIVNHSFMLVAQLH